LKAEIVMVDLFLIYAAVTAVIFVAVFMLLPRYGPHTISRLTCPKCKKKFNYHWVPGASFISLYRLMISTYQSFDFFEGFALGECQNLTLSVTIWLIRLTLKKGVTYDEFSLLFV